MTLFVGFIILVLVIVAGVFGGITLKRNKNAKMCEGGYYCTIFGPGHIWHKIMHADGGIIIKPENNDKKFYIKNEPSIPFPLEGFIIPLNANVPSTMWPVEASKHTQVPVPELVYHVGSSMPLGFNEKGEFVGYIDEKSGVSPEALATLFKSRDTVNLFRQAASDTYEPTQVKPKVSVIEIVILVGVVIAIAVGVLGLVNNYGNSDMLNSILKGFGLQ